MKKLDTGLYYPIKIDELPNSWIADYVGEFTEEIQPGFACGAHSENDIGVAHLRPMNISREGILDFSEVKYVPTEKNDRRLIANDVLFNNTNSPELIGKTTFVTSKGEGLAFSNHMTRLHFPQNVLPQYAALQLHYLWMSRYFLHKCVKHVNQASISSKDLAKTIPFVVPPLNEQKRIVAKIEALFAELDAGVASLELARAQLQTYRQALLKHAFEGKLTAQWRTANADKVEDAATLLQRIKAERQAHHQAELNVWKEEVKTWEANGKPGKKPTKPSPPKDLPPLTPTELADLADLPAGWSWVKIGQLCDVVRGGSPRPAGDPKYYDGAIPFLKVADITHSSSPYLQDYTYTIKEAGLTKTRQISPFTLLLSNSGATLGVPKICLIEATMNDGIAAFLGLPKDTLLYHYYFWQSKTLELRAIDQGAAQPNLNTGLIQEVAIPICSKLEQEQITEEVESRLSVIDQLEQTITTGLQQAEALRQSILKKAFAGQLVPQDPTDEPASALLARIRAAKS